MSHYIINKFNKSLGNFLFADSEGKTIPSLVKSEGMDLPSLMKSEGMEQSQWPGEGRSGKTS